MRYLTFIYLVTREHVFERGPYCIQFVEMTDGEFLIL